MFSVSCEDDIAPSTPQQNPQENIFPATDGVVTETQGPLASTSVLALENYRTEGAEIPIVKLAETKDLPDGATVSYKLQLGADESFSRSVTLNATPGTTEETQSIYSVSAAEWNEAHLYLFGKSPKEKTAYYRVPVYVNLDGSNYRYGSIDYYAAAGEIKETCMDQGFVIEDNYYLLSDATSWDLGNAETMSKFAFKHDPEVSVYDDPVFTINFEVTADQAVNGVYWKIAPQSLIGTDDWSAVLGPEVNGDESLTGYLVSKDAQAGKLVAAGNYEMTINMETNEYTIELLLQPKYLYTPGGSNGWNQDASGWMQLNGDHYYGVFPLSTDGFKICEKNEWNNDTDWGAASVDPALTGTLVNGGTATNIVVPENGTYWARVEFDPASYKLTTYTLIPITRVGLIGSFAASGWGDDIEMTSTDNGATYTVTEALEAGNEIKVRFNGGWDYNLGGDINDMTEGGDNIKVEEGGTYEITLHLLGGVPKLTMVKK